MTPKKPSPNTRSGTSFLDGGGELGALIRAYDWSTTPLGPPAGWAQSLKTAVRIMLTSRQPIWLGWGPELTYLYNDPYKSIIGGKHPRALGQPFADVWREIWDVVGPMAEAVMTGNEGVYTEAQLLIMERHGYQEETYYTFSYSPIPGDDGPGGLICANTDDTRRVIGERQLATLGVLAGRTGTAKTWQDACAFAIAALASNGHDLPFALVYLRDSADAPCTLAAHSAGAAGIADEVRWPCEEVLQEGTLRLMPLDASFDPLPHGAWTVPPSQAAVLPIAASGQTGRPGVLVVGLNPFRQFDESYRGFLELVSGQISAAVANAEAYEVEKRRAEALAELDRAKTAFFSNATPRYHVVAVADGEEAWQAARSKGCSVDAAARILLADDNADMREYVRRLVVSDVMMPRLDGIALLDRLRDDTRTKTLPVILLSARAGEEARLEGLGAGANDYLVKPFSARELLARVGARLEIARIHRENEARLRESEARFKTMANTAPAMLWITDEHHQCTFLSRGWYELTGQTEAEGLGRGWLNAVHPDDRDRAARIFLSAVEHRQPFAFDYRLRRADGEYRWAIDAGRPRIGAGNEFLGYIGSVIDVHERTQAEAAHKAAREVAVLSSRP